MKMIPIRRNSPDRHAPHLDRRKFLSGCAACAVSAACMGPAARWAVAQPAPLTQTTEKPKLRLVFSHITPERPTWPYQGYDYEGRKKELTARLGEACPNVEFLPVTAMNGDDARKILVNDSEVDGYVVYMLGLWPRAGQVIASANRPTLFVDDLYAGSGDFLISYAAAKRKGLKVAGVSSSEFDDVAQAIKAFEVIKRLQSAVILDVTDRDPRTLSGAIMDAFGTSVRTISSEELNAAYEKTDPAEAKKWAERWSKDARKVIEPTREEIEKSGRIYLAMKDLMQQHNSPAITVDCLHIFYRGRMPAYPCLGFFQLNNDGFVGACEADLQSTVTMLLMTALVNRPGFISDPVIDTSKSQIIYAHCVAPSKVYGPDGPRSPYYIRDHSEDRKGAAIRVLMPIGEMTTTLKYNPLTRQVVLHQGRTVANIDEDKACRTKLAAEVRDVYKLMGEWDRWGWHRVTFYGDLRRQVETISALLGFEVVVEG